MTDQTPPPGGYQVGDVVNGYRWNGFRWVQLPVTKPVRGSHWLRNLLVALVVGTVLVAIFVSVSQLSSNNQRPEVSADSQRRDAYTECKVAVLGYLKSPGSADFPWYDPSFVAGSSPKFMVNAYVDAENSFGASIRTGWSCSVSEVAGSWRVNDVVLEE